MIMTKSSWSALVPKIGYLRSPIRQHPALMAMVLAGYQPKVALWWATVQTAAASVVLGRISWGARGGGLRAVVGGLVSSLLYGVASRNLQIEAH